MPSRASLYVRKFKSRSLVRKPIGRAARTPIDPVGCSPGVGKFRLRGCDLHSGQLDHQPERHLVNLDDLQFRAVARRLEYRGRRRTAGRHGIRRGSVGQHLPTGHRAELRRGFRHAIHLLRGQYRGSRAMSPYTVSGLASLTSYTFRIRASDAAGNFSAYSNTVSAATGVNSSIGD
jgi:hypothetical protein